jgi:hypothetical protein
MQSFSAAVNVVFGQEPPTIGGALAVAFVVCVGPYVIPPSVETRKVTTKLPFWLFVASFVSKAKLVSVWPGPTVNGFPRLVQPVRLMTVEPPRSAPLRVTDTISTVAVDDVVLDAVNRNA